MIDAMRFSRVLFEVSFAFIFVLGTPLRDTHGCVCMNQDALMWTQPLRFTSIMADPVFLASQLFVLPHVGHGGPCITENLQSALFPPAFGFDYIPDYPFDFF